MILIGKKLANKAVKVCFYSNIQAIVPFLRKIYRYFFKQKVKNSPEQIGSQLNTPINGAFRGSF
jgi:hypothetical protein